MKSATSRTAMLGLMLVVLISVGGCSPSNEGELIMTPYGSSPVPASSQSDYKSRVEDSLLELQAAVDDAGSAEDVDDEVAAMVRFGSVYDQMASVAPPSQYARDHENLMQGLTKCRDGAELFIDAAGVGDTTKVESAARVCAEGLSQARTAYQSMD